MNSIQERGKAAVTRYVAASKLIEVEQVATPFNALGQSAILLKASKLNPKPINWIWGGWVAGGKFHLLGGVAGTGKTTISLALASSITTGGRFPDGSKAPKGNVVIWTGEDDISDTLTPRLMAMGADLDRIHFVQGMKSGAEERPFDPSTDFSFLKDAIEKVGDVKVLIIDPIVSVVKGDSHKNAEVRKDLTPLVQMAELLGFAIIGITHFSKGTSGREPIERITGSLAFGAVARVVLVASKTKNEDGDDIRIFLRAKSNIGIDTSKVLWGSPIEGSARELLGEAEEESDGGSVKACMSLVTDLLAYGEVSANQMEKDCKGAGFSVATMRRAKKQLGIKSIKTGMGSKGIWVWELPKMLNISKDAHTQNVNTLGKSEHLNDVRIIEGEL